jgi:hypothetical protein
MVDVRPIDLRKDGEADPEADCDDQTGGGKQEGQRGHASAERLRRRTVREASPKECAGGADGEDDLNRTEDEPNREKILRHPSNTAGG